MTKFRWAQIFALITLLVLPHRGLARSEPPSDQLRRATEAVSGNFIARCGFSHRAEDDPIMHPGESGMSHSHDFFGNMSTNANSTYSSLLAADTTCDIGGDTAPYWMPTVYQNGVALEPLGATIYYRNVALDPQSVETPSPGFQMVFGDANATVPQRPKYVGWACRQPNGIKRIWTSGVQECAADEEMVFRVQFPECWNGDTDSTDHRSHVARITKQDVCPATHPINIPRISMTVAFDSQGGSGITLSSGSALTGHMDFINSWDQEVLEDLVDRCLRAAIECGFVGEDDGIHK